MGKSYDYIEHHSAAEVRQHSFVQVMVRPSLEKESTGHLCCKEAFQMQVQNANISIRLALESLWESFQGGLESEEGESAGLQSNRDSSQNVRRIG